MSSEVKREPLWTRNFIAVSVINFFAILIFYLLMVTIAEYAVNEYGVSTSVAGLISSIFVIGGLVGRFIAGPFIVKMGTCKIFIIGIVAYSVTTMLYFLSFNLIEMFLIRILHGIAI